MTFIVPEKIKCGHCGERSEHNVLVSTSVRGAPDLDNRPSSNLRELIRLQLQACPSCGLVAPSLKREVRSVSKILSSERYQSAAADKGLPLIARRFVCRAIIDEARRDLEEAAFDYLSAAWVADDREQDNHDPYFKENLEKYKGVFSPEFCERQGYLPERIDDAENIGERAKQLRRRSALLFRSVCNHEQEDVTWIRMILIDVMRRSEQWADATTLCVSLLDYVQDEEKRNIIAFQRRLIDAQDIRAFTVDHALGKLPLPNAP